MTKKGYTHIIVPTELHSRLKRLAQHEGVSIAKFIEMGLGINTGINTALSRNPQNDSSSYFRKAQNELRSSNGFSANAFSKRVEAGPVGIEPTTYSLGGCRAIHVSPSVTIF